MLLTSTVTAATEEEEEEEGGEEGREVHLSPPPGASGFVSPPVSAPTPLPPSLPHITTSSTVVSRGEHALLLMLMLLLPHLRLGRRLLL